MLRGTYTPNAQAFAMSLDGDDVPAIQASCHTGLAAYEVFTGATAKSGGLV